MLVQIVYVNFAFAIFFLCIGIVDAVLVVDVAAAVIAVVAYLFAFFFNALVDTQNASKQDVPLIKEL